MIMLTIQKSGNWKLYWGVMPLPAGAEAIGIVSRETGTGALIRLANGNYVQGNAGGIRTLPKREVEQAYKCQMPPPLLVQSRVKRRQRHPPLMEKWAGDLVRAQSNRSLLMLYIMYLSAGYWAIQTVRKRLTKMRIWI